MTKINRQNPAGAKRAPPPQTNAVLEQEVELGHHDHRGRTKKGQGAYPFRNFFTLMEYTPEGTDTIYCKVRILRS